MSRAERAQRLRESGVGDPVDAVLASQQAIVRRAYERSIEELSASPSLADQVIARSLEKFIATMPAPKQTRRGRFGLETCRQTCAADRWRRRDQALKSIRLIRCLRRWLVRVTCGRVSDQGKPRPRG
jgi:hypothetical protein